MQYNAPFGNTNTDAPYVNGDPSIGLMGSIPPAASIEYPQREIANFITKSGLAPTNADLFQLAKSVQSGLVNYGLDQGTPNEIVIVPTVPITSYALGQRFVVKMSFGNTSQVHVNVSGLGRVPLIHSDLSTLNAHELGVGQLIEIAFDGSAFQMLSGGAPGSLVTMSAPQDVYVNANIGDDTLYDGTSPVIGGTMGGPFRTIQKALATMSKYNLGGWSFNIHVADGVYANASGVYFPLPNGSGTVNMLGNNSNPAAVSIYNTGSGSCWLIGLGGNWYVSGFAFRATAPTGGDAGDGIHVQNSSTVSLGTNSWGFCPGAHFEVSPGAAGFIFGDQTITGSAAAHVAAGQNGILANTTHMSGGVIVGDINLTIANPVTMNQFGVAADGGQLQPIYKTINGAGNVTGPRFNASGNGVIQTLGRGLTYLPGSSPGLISSGGQYL